jgi:hypothetical protein
LGGCLADGSHKHVLALTKCYRSVPLCT